MSRRRNYIELVPREILTCNIFSHLPVKSLGSCKCVSKSWKALISEPRFIKTHHTETSKGNDTTNIILVSSNPTPGFLYPVYVENNNSCPIPYNVENNDLCPIPCKFGQKLNFDCSNTWSRILGSCDGLILAEDNRTWTSMYLLNPTTLESKRVPILPSGCRNACVFGFGYDISCDDYAIIAIAHRQDSRKKDACVYVYMLKTNQWNKVGFSPYHHKSNNPVPGVFVGGCLHWVAINVDGSSLFIWAFNIANKTFSQLAVANGDIDGGFKLGVLMGCLCMMGAVNCLMELWVMKEYGIVESWVKFSEGIPCSVPDNTLAVLDSGRVLLLVTNAKEGRILEEEKRKEIEDNESNVDS
ncbi:F-box domain-containing protein [Heracleum sosnowskyi]|uniref:F-box domain-containing protein n=1 Tax=Heracleum sosnowskyi TaxID=360622 RepID=A0AAD8N4S8_9APIA|nr:F-box domain-containing protein [Heracleum sosnowskyi]